MEQEFKFCKHCGEKLSADAVFCNACGKRNEAPIDKEDNKTVDKTKLFDIISKVLVIITILWGFVALAFDLVHASVSVLGYTEDELLNGYKVIGRSDALDGLSGWLSFCSIIHLIVFIVSGIFILLKITNGKIKNIHYHIVFIVGIVFSFLYFFNGLGAISVTIEELGEPSDYLKITTASFVPLIIQTILYLTYIIINKLKKQNK